MTLLACAAALPQLITYAGFVHAGTYPGSAFKPRVDALLAVSASAAAGGPFVSVRTAEGRYSAVAGGVLSDLGVGALMDGLGRLRGRPAGVSALGGFNLIALAGALVGLVFALPWPCRAGLVALYLTLPLSVPLYQSPDVVAIHGALAVLAAASAAGSRGRRDLPGAFRSGCCSRP